MDTDLKRYVDENKGKFPKEQIVSNLRQAGYSVNDIDAAFSSGNTIIRGLLIFAIVMFVITAGLVAGGYYLYANYVPTELKGIISGMQDIKSTDVCNGFKRDLKIMTINQLHAMMPDTLFGQFATDISTVSLMETKKEFAGKEAEAIMEVNSEILLQPVEITSRRYGAIKIAIGDHGSRTPCPFSTFQTMYQMTGYLGGTVIIKKVDQFDTIIFTSLEGITQALLYYDRYQINIESNNPMSEKELILIMKSLKI